MIHIIFSKYFLIMIDNIEKLRNLEIENYE